MAREGDASAEAARPVRYKMSLACAECRRRKLRCDDKFPCARCLKSGVECVLGNSRPKAKVRRSAKVSQAHVLDSPPSTTPDVALHTNRQRSRRSTSPPYLRATTLAVTRDSSEADAPLHTQQDEHEVEVRLNEGATFHSLWYDRSDQIICSGPSSGLPMLERLGALHWMTQRPDRPGSHPPTSIPSPRQRRTSPSLPRYPVRDGGEALYVQMMAACPRRWMNMFIRHHFSLIGVMWPILHKPSFLSRYLDVIEHRAPLTSQFAGLLLAICAVNATTVEPSRMSNRITGAGLFLAAQQILRTCTDKISMDYITALYYLAIFAEGTNQQGLEASLLGEAVALAFSTGLHRSCATYHMSPILTETRKRLFWALYSMDLSASSSTGRPSLIHLWECDVEAPLPIGDMYITAEDIIDPPRHILNVDQAACQQIVRIYTVMEQVLIGLNSPHNISSHRRPEFYQAINEVMPDRNSRLARAEELLRKVESLVPAHLMLQNIEASPELMGASHCVLQAHRINVGINFVRTIIARQRIVAYIDDHWDKNDDDADGVVTELQVQRVALQSIQSTLDSYQALEGMGLLSFFNFQAVLHLSTAGHTLLACILRQRSLETKSMPFVDASIRLMSHFAPRFPVARHAISMITSLARTFKISVSSPYPTEVEDDSILDMRLLQRKPPHFTAGLSPNGIRQANSDHHEVQTPDEISDNEWLNAAVRGEESRPDPLLSSVHLPHGVLAANSPLQGSIDDSMAEDESAAVARGKVVERLPSSPAASWQDSSCNMRQAAEIPEVTRMWNSGSTWTAGNSGPWELNFNLLQDGLIRLVSNPGNDLS